MISAVLISGGATRHGMPAETESDAGGAECMGNFIVLCGPTQGLGVPSIAV
jgi:hypothetical protein